MNWQRVFFNLFINTLLILSLILSSPSLSFSHPEGDGKISGYIYNSSLQPLGGVEVRAISSGSIYFHRMSYSAVDGSYSIDQLPVGQYYLRVQNKLGYLNIFYDHAIDKSAGKLIKVNASQHISDINFYLESGGFIRGHIYDAHGKPLTMNTSIGFFDAENLTQRGFINGHSDGSYISPALPSRPHIVKALALPSGYLMTYYPHVSTQDSAQVIYVTPSDTIKNIDFYLQKGGAISGYVYSEEPEKVPVANAWVVVTEWNNGEWSSECYSDISGYYCAAGLRPGAYRVHVYGVDPLKYHNEYYGDSPQRENAAQVLVVPNDTTGEINFRLDAVKKMTLSNKYIEFAVSDRYPGSNLSLGIIEGLPETNLDDNKPILFGHPYPYTSFTTLWIDHKKLIFGSPDGTLIQDPYILPGGKTIVRRWDYQKLAFEQKVTLVRSEWSETKYEDTALIQYIITNFDNRSHEIGIRILFDTMLGRDDAAHIRTSTSPYTGYEQDFYSPDIPAWWTAMEYNQDDLIFSIQGTLRDYGATTPDRFSIVNWSNIFNTLWEYRTDNNLNIIKDSGVALWWEPITLEPGKVQELSTFVGLGEIPPDIDPPYTANHHPAKDSLEVPLSTNIQLDILDDYSGVDSATIKMGVNGHIVDYNIQGIPKHYTIFYDPPQNFCYNDTVQVIVEAADLAVKPNYMRPDTLQFYIKKDITPPFIQNLYPQPKARNILSDTCLSFILSDEHTGVNRESIHILIKEKSVHPQIEGDSGKYSIRYPFQPPFGERDSVWVRISARDLVMPPNQLDFPFYFFVVRDSIAPRVSNYYPLNQATEVDLDTTIFIDLVDDFAGIDSSSLTLSLNDIVVKPKIEGDSSHYMIFYRPIKGFLYNEQVKVTLLAQDLAKLPNKMEPFIFTFSTETDNLPPSITLLTPPENDTTVTPTPLIALEIKDEKAGVDATSILVWINNDPVPFERTGTSFSYQINYRPLISFKYLDWVTVAVTAQDVSNPPNIADTVYFKFRIMREKDEQPPYVTLYQPEKGKDNIDPNCVISFHIRDDMSGVDSSSIRVQLNSAVIEPAITGYRHDYLVAYDPPAPFDYGQQVRLEIAAQDLAPEKPNVMKTDSCLFTIVRDISPPEVSWIAPAQPGDHIPLDSEFRADIADSQTGVNFISLKFKLQGQFITPVLDYHQKNCRLQYKPEEKLKYNQQIQFVITGTDLAKPPNWIQDSLFIFYTLEDHDAPFVSGRSPDRDDRGVQFNPEIAVYLDDDVAGVDVNSIVMTVAGTKVSPEVTGTLNHRKLSYTEGIGFRPGQEVKVTIDAADLSNPPNLMTTDRYSFFIEEVHPDLIMESFKLNQSRVMVHHPIQTSATIRVINVPVYDTINLRLWDNEVVIVDTMLSPMKKDEIVNLSRSLDFNFDGTHQIKIMVDPENKINESNEQNNSAIQIIDVAEGELVVRSNPFTPNGDGKNDIVTFDFEKLSVTEPQLKLYDVAGRMIATLRQQKDYKFVWDGIDHYGNPTQPGVYLYLLQDQGKTIANGYVVLAR